MLTKYCILALGIICSIMPSLAQGGLSYDKSSVRLIGRTPKLTSDYGVGVSGHVAWLHRGEKQKPMLVMAGGCNFPTQGGAKQFYSDVYGAPFIRTDSLGRWQRIGSLPQAVAYAAVAWRDGYQYILGGQTPQGDTSLAYRIRLDIDGRLLVDSLPPLPEPRAGATAQWVGNRLYIFGGRANGRLTNTMLSIGRDRIWREEPSYPASPLLKLLSWTDGSRIYMIGSVTGGESDQSAELSMTGICYTPSTKLWMSMALPGMLEGATFGGGLVLVGHGRIFLTGGVHAERFLPAIRKEQALRKAKGQENSSQIRYWQDQLNEYLAQPVEWYRFNNQLWEVKIDSCGHTAYMLRASSPLLARADAAMVALPLGGFLQLGGERKPGVRTTEIALIVP